MEPLDTHKTGNLRIRKHWLLRTNIYEAELTFLDFDFESEDAMTRWITHWLGISKAEYVKLVADQLKEEV